MPLTIAEADAYLQQTDRWEAWGALTGEEKERALFMARLKLQSAYPCLSGFSDDVTFLQAAYMRTAEYRNAQGGVSSVSAGTSSVSMSWHRGEPAARADGLDQIVLGLIGDPETVCPGTKHGAVKSGYAL